MSGHAAAMRRCRGAWVTLVLIPAVVPFVGCAPAAQTRVAAVPAPACLISGGTAPESLTIFESGGSLLHSAIDRLIAAQLYEPLIAADCEGRARSGVAESWTLDPSRTRVTLTLRPDARFSDGQPIAASDVIAGWRASDSTTGQPYPEWTTLARRLADASTVIDAHTLLVSLPDTNLLVLAEPALAVARSDSGSRLEGSGAYRFGPSTRTMVTLLPNDPSAPRLDIHMNGGDARDAIDAGGDVVITDDPAAVSYASGVARHSAVALPWTRTYLLVSPQPISIPPASLGEAVRQDTRPAALPAWLEGMRQCEFDIVHGSTPSPRPTDRRIAFEAGDDVARQLAERFVALGVAPGAARMTTTDFDAALRDGSETAYVVAVPARSLAPCVDRQALLARVPWLGADSGSWLGIVTPLVDTRLHAIVRTDRVSATIGWDGTLRFGEPHAP